MRRIRLWAEIGLVCLLLSPAAAFAQPDRLDGTFDFEDVDQGLNNTLEFQLVGRTMGVSGEVSANVGPNVVVRIHYSTDFPDSVSASSSRASIGQGRQVTIELEVVDTGMTTYFGEAAPKDCRVSAKVKGSGPGSSQAALKCDLSGNLQQLAPQPSGPVLDVVEQAFAGRKDVKVNTGSGKLQIKHKGEPVP